MPKFVYQPDEAKDQVPAGPYRVRFLGSDDKDPFDGPSKFGGSKSQERRYLWKFEILDGPHQGVILTQNTGQSPGNALSACYNMLSWLLGRPPHEREPIDSDSYIGRTYEVDWRINPRSDAKRCHIAFMKPLGSNSQPAPRPAPVAVSQPVRKGPPPIPAATPAPARPEPETEPDGTFYCQETGEQGYTWNDLQTWIAANGKDPKTLQVAKDGEAEWKPAEVFGFQDTCIF